MSNQENLNPVKRPVIELGLGAITLASIVGTVWGLTTENLQLAGVSAVVALGSTVVGAMVGEPKAENKGSQE